MVKTAPSSKRKRITIPEQEPITFLTIGELWYIPRQVIVSEKRIDLAQLSLEELKALMPDGFRPLTLREDLNLLTLIEPFKKVYLDSPEYGPISFWGVESPPGTQPNQPRYQRAFFRLNGKKGHVIIQELVPLTYQDHWVDTQLTNLKVASLEDAMNAIKEQEMPQNIFKTFEGLLKKMKKGNSKKSHTYHLGVMATIVQHGKKEDQIYVSEGRYVLFYHSRYGTPIFSIPDYKSFQGFVAHAKEHLISSQRSPLHYPLTYLTDYQSNVDRAMEKRGSLEYISNRRNCIWIGRSQLAEHGDDARKINGFYLLKEK